MKYGKVGTDFGLDSVFKRPLILFRLGACFRTTTPREHVGRAIAMNELLAHDAAEQLRGEAGELNHLAFGLVVPAMAPVV